MRTTRHIHSIWGGSWCKHGLLLGRLHLTYERRGSHQTMGRFGGGWNWKLGLQWSRTCCLISLLVVTVELRWCSDERLAKLREAS